tara:strand:- start:926 stop:1078 length:153 start_codon:yes stop_codon:yes gene_type:complete
MNNKKLKNIKQTWNSKRMKDLQKMHLEGRYTENVVCKECINSSSNHGETI